MFDQEPKHSWIAFESSMDKKTAKVKQIVTLWRLYLQYFAQCRLVAVALLSMSAIVFLSISRQDEKINSKCDFHTFLRRGRERDPAEPQPCQLPGHARHFHQVRETVRPGLTSQCANRWHKFEVLNSSLKWINARWCRQLVVEILLIQGVTTEICIVYVQ